MEPSQSTPSLQHSPTSTSEGPGVSSSATSPDVPIESSSKKRKASTAESEKPTTHGPRSKKLAHNVIEKRYRNNLNDKFQMLRNRVPTMRAMLRGVEIEGSDMEDLEGLAPAHNFSKSTILTKAIEYIDHLEKLEKQEKKRINQVSEENSALKDEIATLRARLDAYEHNSVQTPLGLHHPVTPPEHIHYHEDPFAVAPQGRPVSQGIPQGMIPVPENMRNLHRSAQPQPHYATQNIYYPRMHNRVTQGQQMQPRLVHSNGQMLTGRLGKAMIGGFAGLMLLQGFREREESSGRALFSFPTYVLQYLRAILFPPGSGFGVTDNFINLLKIVLFVGSVLYCLEPTFVYIHYLYRPSPPPRAISAAPSVASPVEIRRKAWLTAIQTVWVPRHNILFELSALALKIVKIAVRNAIGWRGYSRITGMTEEQEAGRIKAWEIALDAQLTGGDEEISMSRLLLSFMASWTLPSNPSRSLIRSLQSRIIARDFANAKYGAGSVIEVISMTVAKYYWEKAVEQRSTFRTDNAPLSPHIATLLSLEFSEVMVPSVIQRAFNLAWNKSSAADTDADAAMDNVVLDSAIYSPLDAVAAWTSTLSLQRILARYLENDVSSDDQLAKALQVTIDVAPPTSQARARALVAKAIIVDQHRAINVAEAFHELPCHPTSPVSDSPGRVTLINAVGNAPIANDIRVSLALAKCLELLSYGVNQPGGPSAYTRALDLINKASLYEMDFSWLSFAAMYTMLVTLASDKVFIQEAGHGLEAMASHMRTWKGLQVDQTELSSEAIKRIITKCTEVSKYVVGLKASVGKGEVVEDGVDDGYASLETMSVHAGD
ncbi:hypothetical protein M501DRAFT_936364 [Patellaria atrata CBS 101060]|uniref:BHLH domain-containing protein n=1 Tax=Patellaria atrata CBS 101060 TaxID=1346257 RepID=A0A9P4S994_9PEZI|nr:hypothetical protein M501DRAFT_936364 [Patellaria atrata CBS 101060]